MTLQQYQQLVQDIKGCKNCDLCEEGVIDGLDPHVPPQGSLDASVVFVAQNPGEFEVRQQQPLTSTGKSGKVYDKCLATLGLTREQVWTSNIVLCHSPGNREPVPYECLKCKGFLERQLQLIRPKLVVSFGRLVGQSLLSDFKMTRDHGKLKHSDVYGVEVFPLFHPAYVGCYAKASDREAFKRDLATLKRYLNGSTGFTGTKFEPKPPQFEAGNTLGV